MLNMMMQRASSVYLWRKERKKKLSNFWTSSEMSTEVLQTAGGPSFGDGRFQPQDHVTIHGISNLPDGLRAKVFAYDPDAKLYVVKDAKASIWGVRSEKLCPIQTLAIEEVGNEWQDLPEGIVVPQGLEIYMNLATGRKSVRRIIQQ
jgi:hypothetical protein